MLAKFKPKIIEAMKGYSFEIFMKDALAGLAVGVVALPLAMAFAIASGLAPSAGLFTAVVGGGLISLLGGSRVQIGGPAGAFIVIVYGIVAKHGVSGLALATAMSGLMLFAMGLFRLGVLVRFVPVAVVIGFTNGIAALIALSQVKDFAGLRVERLPADFMGICDALWTARASASTQALWLSGACLVFLAIWGGGLPRWAKKSGSKTLALAAKIPGSVLALVGASAAVAWLGLDVETIGSKFGLIPAVAPSFAWPSWSWAQAKELLAPAATLAALGAIESLLCARVADSMSGDRHDSNQELMAQGVANFASPFFGGMPATGTIARTVANINSGGRTPVAGLCHAAAVLAAMLLCAPLAAKVPMSVLAAILMFVAWNMGEWREFARLAKYRMPYRVTLLLVFGLTVAVDLSAAVEAGLAAACVTFIYRISSLSKVDAMVEEDYPELLGLEGKVAAARVYGAIFFGAVDLIERMGRALPKKCLLLDMKNVIYVDSTGAEALLDLGKACEKSGVELWLCELGDQPLDIMRRMGLDKASGIKMHEKLAGALKAARGWEMG